MAKAQGIHLAILIAGFIFGWVVRAIVFKKAYKHTATCDKCGFTVESSDEKVLLDIAKDHREYHEENNKEV